MIFPHFKPAYAFTSAFLLSLAGCNEPLNSTSPVTTDSNDITETSLASRLLVQVVAAPGVDLWLGDDSAGIEREPMVEKFPLYAIHHDRFAVSEENLRRLRPHRDAIIAKLKPVIESTAKGAMALPTAAAEIPSLETELAIALDLNAVELLDLLAGTTMQLQTFLANFESGKLETYLFTTHARLHRNLLGAISGILKQEGFAPVVNEEWESDFTFEKAQGDSSLNLLEDSVFTGLSTPDIPVGGLAPFTTAFSQRLIDWAVDYINETPVDQRKCSAGMETPVPFLR